MKKFKKFDMHQRRFLTLATVIFGVVGMAHTLRVLFAVELSIGEFEVSHNVSVLVAFITLCMAAMGIGYLIAKD